MRTGAVNYLKDLGWNVKVVMPNFETYTLEENENIIKIPISRNFNTKVFLILERLGLLEDYLDSWCENTVDYLKSIVKKNDFVFCTTGGDLSSIKVGSLLKEQININFVANYRSNKLYNSIWKNG